MFKISFKYAFEKLILFLKYWRFKMFIKIKLPIYFDEDIPDNFPSTFIFKNSKEKYIELLINTNTGEIINFPNDINCNLFMKVVDEGTYILLDDSQENVLGKIEQYYVPNKAIPPTDGYGDYIDFNISKGYIINWYKEPNFEEFYEK